MQYGYNLADRLVEVERYQHGRNWHNELANFEYNGDGLRVSQTADGGTTPYLWDVAAGLPQVLVEGPYLYNYGHTLLNRVDPATGQSLAYAPDGLGGVRLTVNPANGQMVDQYRYAPFGWLLSGDESDNTRRFTGESYDPATRLYYLRARYYDPTMGRFLTQDAFPGLAADPTTQHVYAYVGNNPVNWVDPGGNFAIAAVLGAVGAGGLIGVARGGDFSWGGLGKSTLKGIASGAAAGLVGFGLGGLLSGLGGFGLFGAVLGGGATGVATSGVVQIVDNLLTPCRKRSLNQVSLPSGVACAAWRWAVQRASRLAIRLVMGTAKTSPMLPTNVRTISSATGSRLRRRESGS